MVSIDDLRIAIMTALALAVATTGISIGFWIMLGIFAITFAKDFSNFMLCSRCKGSGKRKCGNCSDGYLKSKPRVSPSYNLEKEGESYKLRINNVSVTNDSFGTTARIRIRVFHRLGEVYPKKLGEWLSNDKFEIKGFDTTKIIDNPIYIKLENTENVERVLKRDIDIGNINVESRLVDEELLEECASCSGRGYFECERFDIGLKDRSLG
ncbi:MAG: hypothetical protein ACE5J4_00960 [Candidatus Aenigmatarchaeota archaeon]